MSHRLLTSLLIISLLLTRAAAAQPPRPPDDAQPSAATNDGSYVIEQKHLRTRFEKDGTGLRELTMRVKLLGEQAVREWGQLPLVYASDTEELTLDRVQVKKPDGTTTTDAAKAVQDLAVRPAGNVPLFVDIRQKQITIASLRPGDTLEIVATWRIRRPVTPQHFWFEHSFITTDIVLDERLEIDLPADTPAVLKVRAASPQEQNGGEGRIEEGRRIYRWTSSNTARPSPDAKPAPYTGDGSPADVRLTSYKTWDEVGRWFSGLLSVPVNGEVKAKALELTRGIADPARRVEAIYDYVSKEIRYVSLSFGIGRYAPHAPGEVLKNQYGDCKDKAALLSAMLAAIGVESLPVLLHSRRSLDESVASPLELDHVITVVPQGDDPARWLWMDATTEVAPIGMLMAEIRDKRVLLVGAGRHATRMLRTPADPPFPNVDIAEVKGQVNEIGVLNAQVKFTLRGDAELLTRALLRIVPPEGAKELVRGLAQAVGIDGEFSDEKTSDPNSTRDPLEVSANVRMSGFLKWAARTSEIRTLPATPIPYSKEGDRRDETSLDFGSPNKQVLRAVIDLPAGYTMQPPVPVTTEITGMAYVSRYTADANRLLIARELEWGARKIEAPQFGEYSAFVRAVQADLSQKVKVTRSSEGLPVIPADATATELYAAAFSAFEAKDYEAAVALWKRNTEVDPKMGDAWISLGLAHAKLKQYDEAAAAIQKQLERDPFDKRGHGDLGDIYEAAGKLEAAAKSYARHLEINPLDGETLESLGAIHNELKQYPQAAAALEKASTLGKLGAWGYADLAEAYLRQQQHEKATTAIDRALEISPKPNIWTRLGWLLADTGYDLERARTLALKTVEHVASVTGNLEAASIETEHFDLMKRLAWSWNAIGKIAFRNGRLDEAERYASAAWKLGREPEMALDLARIHEKRDRLSDAVNFYMTAYAKSSEPTEEMKAHVKRLVGEGDYMKPMFESARRLALNTAHLPEKGFSGRAEYLVVLGPDRRALDLKFVLGTESIRPVERSLRTVQHGVEFPSEMAMRLALKLEVACGPSRGCDVLLYLPGASR